MDHNSFYEKKNFHVGFIFKDTDSRSPNVLGSNLPFTNKPFCLKSKHINLLILQLQLNAFNCITVFPINGSADHLLSANILQLVGPGGKFGKEMLQSNTGKSKTVR